MISVYARTYNRHGVDMARVATVMKPALVILLVLALLLTVAWLAQRRLVYLPDRTDPPPAAQLLPDGRDVTLRTDDGPTLTALLAPARGSSQEIAVLVAPGNAGNRRDRVPLAEALNSEGFDVLLLDYRGYGGNPGRPTEEGLAHDARAAYRWLVDEHGTDPQRLIYFGESLGAGVVTELATAHPPGGLVLRSPFVDLAAAGRVHYPFLPVRTMLWDRYPVAEQVAQVEVPTAVVYGSQDSIIPPEQSREVAGRAAGPMELTRVDGADHNDPRLLSGSQVVAAVVAVAGRIDR